MPVLDAHALDADPEGLAVLHAVIHDSRPGEGAPRRLPAKDAFDPARRRQPLADLAPATASAERRRPALVLES